MIALPGSRLSEVQKIKNGLVEHWQIRNERMRKDREIISLKEPTKRQGFASITLNDPRVQFQTSVSILSSFQPKIRIPMVRQSGEELADMGKAERWVDGVWRAVDDNQAKTGHPLFLYELAYWACLGWICWFPYIEKVDGVQQFSCEMFDPITVYPEWGKYGLRRLLRHYYVPRAQAEIITSKNRWNISLLGKSSELVEVISLWESERGTVSHEVWMDAKPAKPRKTEPFQDIPVGVLLVGGSPEGASIQGDREYIGKKGDSIIAASRGQFAIENKIATLLMQIIQDCAYPSIVEFTVDGVPGMQRGSMGSGTVHTYELNEKVDLMRHAAIPIQEASHLLSMVSQGIQQAGLPAIVHGNLPFEISGFMGSQLFMAIKYKLNAQLDAMRYVLGRSSTEFLRQYRTGNIDEMQLVVENPRRKGKGETFIEQFRKEDIPDVTYVDVRVPLGTMVDKVQQVNLGRMALNEPKLMSRPTFWEDFLEIEDPGLEYERLSEDAIEDLPAVKIIQGAERLENKAAEAETKGRQDIAERFRRYADALLATIPGQQQPQSTGGMQSGAIPPEASRLSPDMLRAAAGIQTAGGAPGARTVGAARRAGGEGGSA